MRITFIMLGLRDHSTGGYSFNSRMAGALERAGHDVRVIHYNTIPEKIRGSRIGGSLHVLRSVLRKRPDIIIVSKSYSFMGPLRLLLPLLRIPVLYLVHHLEWHDRLEDTSGFRKAFVRWFLRGGSRIWVNSSSTAADVAALGIKSNLISVVSPGYDPFPAPEMSHRELPVKIISVGTLCPRKDQLTLVKSCALLKELDFRLYLLGDETTFPEYSRQVREFAETAGIEDRVLFKGHLSTDDLHRFYRECHIMVNLSRWEGYGIAVAEALQSGLPVVAADAGAVPELIEHGVHGYLVPPGNSEACGEFLELLVESGTLREELSANARNRACDLLTWEDSETEFIRLVEHTASCRENRFG